MCGPHCRQQWLDKKAYRGKDDDDASYPSYPSPPYPQPNYGQWWCSQASTLSIIPYPLIQLIQSIWQTPVKIIYPPTDLTAFKPPASSLVRDEKVDAFHLSIHPLQSTPSNRPNGCIPPLHPSYPPHHGAPRESIVSSPMNEWMYR